MKVYKGTIVQESLQDDRQINDFQVIGLKVTSQNNPHDRWHLCTVLITESDIEKLASNLKPQKWYAHFWCDDQVIAVFPQKIFKFLHSDKSTWAQAIEYGKSVGIPDKQLDFVIEE